MVNYRSKISDPKYPLALSNESRKSDDPESIGARLADESIKNQIKKNGETQENEVVKKWKGAISGIETFVLYDTYGFPPELTKESVLDKGIDVDIYGFNKEMNKQRERGRISGKKFGGGNNEIKFEIDAFKKECLLEGLDDIALSLEQSEKISSYENKLKKNKSWIN